MSEPTCPKCHGPMWDNRGTPDKPKANPKAPDYKCKDKACDGVIWPPKDAALQTGTPGEARALSAEPNAPPAFDWQSLPPEILARAAAISAKAAADGGFKPAQALAAAYHFAETGEILGRHAYVGTIGQVAGQVLEGYRGVTRELDMSRYQYRYRPMTADERDMHGIEPACLAVICELDVLEARRQCVLMQVPYSPIIGIGIISQADRVTTAGKPKDPPKSRSWYWVAQKRARVDALRQVGENTSAEDVLDEAAANGIRVDVPEGVRLTQEQAELLTRPAAPPVAAVSLGQPAGFEGYGDDEPDYTEGDFTPVAPEPALTPAAVIRARLTARAAELGNGNPPDATLLKKANGAWGILLRNDDQRHAARKFVFGVDAANDLTAGQCAASLEWIDPAKMAPDADNPRGYWLPTAQAVEDVKVILAEIVGNT